MIALFLPDKPIDFPLVSEYIDFMTKLVPSIAGYAKKSQFPHVSAFYFSFSSLIFLPWLIYELKHKGMIMFGSAERMEQGYVRVKGKRFPRLLCVAGLLFCLFIAWAIWIQPGNQWNILPINEKRWALAIVGPFGAFFYMAYLMTAFGRTYISFFIRINKER